MEGVYLTALILFYGALAALPAHVLYRRPALGGWSVGRGLARRGVVRGGVVFTMQYPIKTPISAVGPQSQRG